MVKILIVEDDEPTSEVIHELCGQHGVECKTAKNLTEAKNIATEWRPDLVYLDVRLEGECGLDLIDWLRDKCVPPPHILVASASTKASEQAAPYKPEYFLAKPFNLSSLEQIMLNEFR